MKRKVFLIAVFLFFALSFNAVWSDPQMTPGKWEITTKTEMAGMPPQILTHTQCITSEDIVPMSRNANKECQVTDIKNQGNTVSWKISCGGQHGGMNGTGSVTYSGDTMNGKMYMTITGSNMKIVNHISGRRIGPCD
jgi:hypothetical protein